MQEMISQVLRGNFEYERASLDFSCTKIEMSVRRGQQTEKSFHIFGTGDGLAEGYIYSSDLRMECLTGTFQGNQVEIVYCFHGENLEEGDVVKGSFCVVSNKGEYSIPFVVTVEYEILESSIGPVRNLFHFANLARENWQEAVKLFYSPAFSRILEGNDAQFTEDYRALSAHRGNEQNLEEFLIRVHKKQKVEYTSQKELEIGAVETGGVTERELTIVRTGWGYTRLTVECQGEFLFTEKEVLTDDDFLGNQCQLPVFVDGSLLHGGRNFGQILLGNGGSYLAIPVVVETRRGYREPGSSGKRHTRKLMELYLAFRTRKIGKGVWQQETGKLVERLVARDENAVPARLFQAQLLITEGRINEAGWILDHVAELLEQQPQEKTCLAYYLYLTTLIHGEEAYVNKVASDVERLYRQDDSNWRIAWLLLYLSEEYHKSLPRKWEFLGRQFALGCRSPILYVEAVAVLQANPALLRRIGQFEQQVLWFGVKEDILKQEVIEQLLYLAGKVKEYSGVLFRILKKLYERSADLRLLQEICGLLIKGGRQGKAYFAWYSAGVEGNLRITNLYEYYMMSLDLDTQVKIPKAVLLYFSYQNHLDYGRTAYLYDYVLQCGEKLGDIYETYSRKMERFVTEQIKKGHINRPLASLYNRLLQPDMVNEHTAGPLSRLLFAHVVQVEDRNLSRVYVYQPGKLSPAEYVLVEGCAWVSIYGSSYTLVFEDVWQNRYVGSVEYTMEKLMIPGRFLRLLPALVRDNLSLDLYLCDGTRGGMECREDVLRTLRVVSSEDVDTKVRRRLYLQVLQYAYDNDALEELDDCLSRPLWELTMEEKGIFVSYMIRRGMYEQAGEWLTAYGPYFIDIKLLVRLLRVLLERSGPAADETLLASAVYVFQKGKYDGTVLEYLTAHYRGTTKSMRDIWKAARDFGVECYRISEAILVQMLYTGAFVGEKMDIFRYYLSQGARPEVEEAFLNRCAYEYFVKERVMEADVFREIGSMYLRGEPVQTVCKLAYLKYCAAEGTVPQEETSAILEDFLKEMMEAGIRLEYFRSFRKAAWVQQELEDKTILEYRAQPGSKARVHYVLLHENGESEDYVCEYMREVYGGVFAKEFILFFGESLQYYITEERDGREQLTVSGTLLKSDSPGGEGNSRFQLINDILISKSLQDTDTLDNLLEEYYRKDYLGGRLFRLKG